MELISIVLALAGILGLLVADATVRRVPAQTVWHDDFERKLAGGRRTWPLE